MMKRIMRIYYIYIGEKFYRRSDEIIKRLEAGERAFVAAFSINAKRTKLIFNNILNRSKDFNNLLSHKELYLIGIEV